MDAYCSQAKPYLPASDTLNVFERCLDSEMRATSAPLSHLMRLGFLSEVDVVGHSWQCSLGSLLCMHWYELMLDVKQDWSVEFFNRVQACVMRCMIYRNEEKKEEEELYDGEHHIPDLLDGLCSRMDDICILFGEFLSASSGEEHLVALLESVGSACEEFIVPLLVACRAQQELQQPARKGTVCRDSCYVNGIRMSCSNCSPAIVPRLLPWSQVFSCVCTIFVVLGPRSSTIS